MHTLDTNGDAGLLSRPRWTANQSPWCRRVGKRGNAREVTINDPPLTFCQFVTKSLNLWNANDLAGLNASTVEAHHFADQISNAALWDQCASDIP